MNLSKKLASRLQTTEQVNNDIVEIKEDHLDLISGAGVHGSAHASGHVSGHGSIGKSIN
jgi:hypothetical protein